MNLRSLFVLVFLVYLTTVLSKAAFSNSTTSTCECLLQEDQPTCNSTNPKKTVRRCSLKLTQTSCESVNLQGRRLCVWRDRTSQNLLAEHSKEFDQPEILTVVPGKVHVGIGFGLANSIILEGDDGVVIVDTLESVDAANDFKNMASSILNSKPVKAVVYLHGHSDHIQGAAAFIPTGSNIPIYAHKDLISIYSQAVIMNGAIFQRSMRQFGTYLTEGPNGLINDGIGPFLLSGQGYTTGYVTPNTFVDQKLDVNISGIEFTLVSRAGETEDQLNLLIPSLSLVVVADNVYNSFPNLYTIRGTKPRDARLWYQSVDQVIDFEAEIMIGTHTRPVIGKELIKQTLTNYRDGIQYLYDKTRYWMNQGVGLEDIASKVKLPDYLAQQDFLKEYYGLIEYHVKSIYIGELGWFGGSAKDLSPLSPTESAKRLIALGKGTYRTILAARQSLTENTREGDQWALELSHAILLLDPSNVNAKEVKILALRGLAYRTVSSITRNYYLSEAKRTEGQTEFTTSSSSIAQAVNQSPVSMLLEIFNLRLNTNKTDNVYFNTLIRFSDVDHYSFRIRRHVSEMRNWTPNTAPQYGYNLTITCSSITFKSFFLNPTLVPQLLSSQALLLSPTPANGGVALLQTFTGYYS